MQTNRFTWDKVKDIANINKHKVDFHEASTVFKDPFVIYSFDDEHSVYEDRFIAIGMSKKANKKQTPLWYATAIGMTIM